MAMRSLRDLLQLPHWINQALCLDLGSRNTRVMVERKLVYHQPSCFTWHASTQTVLNIGQEALQSFDKTPSSVELVFPLRQGRISQPTLAQAYLKAVLTQVFKVERRLPIVLGITGTIATPASLTPVEQYVLKDTLAQVGITHMRLMAKTEAIQAFLSGTNRTGHHACVIDLGAQTVDVGLFTQGSCLQGTTILTGGDAYTQEIISVLKDEYQTEIGWLSAERLKYESKRSDKQASKSSDHKLTVRGKHTVTGVPTTVAVSSGLLQERFSTVTQHLIEELQLFLAQAPAELLTSALEQGLYLTGGGSLLPGVVEDISQELKTHFGLSKSPQEDVIRGLAYGTEN